MLPVLRAASNGEVRISNVVQELASQLNLTPDGFEFTNDRGIVVGEVERIGI